ncbi:MAG TPA: TonB-dependent receptor [Thermoanaerobaculia bacterium]|nr:TonB-dependent receptor [Thermoanaerobaculia bacterium]
MILAILLLAAQQQPYSETIVVTAERIEQPVRESTAAITVLRAEDLEHVQTLGDALRLVPGLQLIDVNPGAPPMVSSRGFFGAGEVEYMQLLVDGVPVGDPETGLADWRSIPIEDIERIEVVRGPGSSLFGDTSLGGVVQVFRKHPASHASVSIGSFGTRRVSGAVTNASVSHERTDGFRKHGAAEETFAHVAFGGFSLDGSKRDREIPGVDDSALFDHDREESRRLRAAYRRGGLLLHVSDRHTDQTRTLVLVPGFGDTARRNLDTRTYGAAFTRKIGGVELTRETIDSRYRVDIHGNGSRTMLAAFVSQEWRVARRVRLAAGARWDAINDSFEGNDVSDRAFSPRVGASIAAGAVTIYAQLARAFKAPTLDQRFDLRPFPGGFTISNAGLESQHATNVEAGVRGGNWEAIAYVAHVDDEIDFDVRTFRYGNIGRSRHRGIETSYRGRYASLGYTWTRVQAEGSSRQLKNIAEHVVRASLDFGPFHVGVEHSANRWLDDENRFPLDDATLVDLRVTHTLGSITAALEAHNVLDRRYAPLGFALGDVPFTYPAAGRSVALTLTWKGRAPCAGCSSPLSRLP